MFLYADKKIKAVCLLNISVVVVNTLSLATEK